VRRKGHCSQGIIWAKVQCNQGFGVRALIHMRTYVIDHVRGMGCVVCCTSKAETHSVVNVDEVGATEFARLILEDIWHSIVRHVEELTNQRRIKESEGMGRVGLMSEKLQDRIWAFFNRFCFGRTHMEKDQREE